MKKFLKCISLLVCFSIILLPGKAEAQLYINEWNASNSAGVSDPDFNGSADWIEIFNDFNDDYDISGFYLSDNLSNPTKWRFPDGTIIGANGYLLIWADREDTGLHTNFGLSKDGEEIGLYDKNATQLDAIVYEFQKTNVSMGRKNDGSSTIGFFTVPTPNASNSTTFYEGITFYQPEFSVGGGLYNQPFELSLKAIDGIIKYTTDGSFPTIDSPVWTEPISISKTTIIRAGIFEENRIQGKTVTQSYFFDSSLIARELPIISISSDPKYFWSDSIGLYVQNFKPSWEYPINIELFENDGSNRAAFNELAGTKVNGLNSWVLPQKMLGIYFDNDYDKNNLDYQLFFDSERKRFDNFTLRASGSDWGSTLIRDALCQELTSENMDVEKMDYRPAIAFINGEYMGIHNIRSRIDEGFIEENFGLASNEYDLIENNGNVEEGDDVAFRALFELLDLDLTNPTNFQTVADVLDVPNITDYFITEIWSSNSSWGHNIQMWKPKTGGKWRWILQDLDRGFTGSDNDLISRFTTDTSPSSYNWARKPLNSLLQNETYGIQFATRFADHLYTTYHPDRVIPIIQKFHDHIDQELPFHSGRWAGTTSSYGNGIPSVDYWEARVADLRTFALERGAVMYADLQQRFDLEDLSSLTTISVPVNAGTISINQIPIPGSPWVGSYFNSLPFELEARPAVGQKFIGWSSASYINLIDKNSEWRYLDNGSDQGTEWRKNNFNDTSWSSGKGEIGYGDGDEMTTVSFGSDPNNKNVTTYFRRNFEVENVQEFPGTFQIQLKRDDGAVVYLNGTEIIRSNMPNGSIESKTYASQAVTDADESTYFSFVVNANLLIEGQNTLAVEIHQVSSSSSDISFDLELKALKANNGQVLSSEKQIQVNLSSDTVLVANYESLNLCTLPRQISENTTLTIDCSPYLAVSDVEVIQGISLIIEEGVEIQFPENANFKIYGDLQINGSALSPVIFTSQEDANQWGGIIFHYATGISNLNHLEISYASDGLHPIYENAAISAFHSEVHMEHIKIESVFSNPILTYYSDVTLRNSSLHSEVTGDLINIKYGKGLVENCTFEGNQQIDTDAIDFDGVENGIIRGNTIRNFLGFNSDGIDIGEETMDVLVEGNFIQNCTDKAISVGQSSTLIATNNTIVNCAKGIAVKDQSSIESDRNTFYNVSIPVACFEKNVGLGGGIGIVSNSILSNSSEKAIDFDQHSNIVLMNSLSDTDTFNTNGNILANPLFANPSFNDFTLLPGSSAFQAGIDDSGNPIDLGSFSENLEADPSLMITAIQYFPSHNFDAEFIEIFNPGLSQVSLSGYTISNAISFVFPTNRSIASGETIIVAMDPSLVYSEGKQIFQWESGRLSNEGEKIILTDPNGIVADFVFYDNKAPWPNEADGNGEYLKLISTNLDNHFGESWTSSVITSSHDLDANLDVSIFPNPASSIINIQSKQLNIQTVSLVNVLGQTIYSKYYNDQSDVNIDISTLLPGTYFIKVNSIVIKTPFVVIR